MHFVFVSLLTMLLGITAYGQVKGETDENAGRLIIPAYTAYVHPNEQTARVDERKGIVNWKDENEDIRFYFYINTPGSLSVSLNLKSAGCKLCIKIDGSFYQVNVNGSTAPQLVEVCKTNIAKAGFQCIIIKGLQKTGDVFANIQSLELYGSATKGIHFNAKARRNSASVHLSYPVPPNTAVEWFYNEITVPEKMDPVNTYYMACGFDRGYFGIQVNSPTERRVIFSIWDAGNEAENRDKVADSLKVRLIAKGDGVFSGDFGNEGTGGHSHWIYNWETEQTYQFLVHAEASGTCTAYSGYFKAKSQSEWKLISSWKAPEAGSYLKGLYSFVENFWGTSGDLERKTFFGNQWILNTKGEWIELTSAKFSYDATGHAGDRIDYSAGVENGNFYLSNGGFIQPNIKYGAMIERAATGKSPGITLPGK